MAGTPLGSGERAAGAELRPPLGGRAVRRGHRTVHSRGVQITSGRTGRRQAGWRGGLRRRRGDSQQGGRIVEQVVYLLPPDGVHAAGSLAATRGPSPARPCGRRRRQDRVVVGVAPAAPDLEVPLDRPDRPVPVAVAVPEHPQHLPAHAPVGVLPHVFLAHAERPGSRSSGNAEDEGSTASAISVTNVSRGGRSASSSMARTRSRYPRATASRRSGGSRSSVRASGTQSLTAEGAERQLGLRLDRVRGGRPPHLPASAAAETWSPRPRCARRGPGREQEVIVVHADARRCRPGVAVDPDRPVEQFTSLGPLPVLPQGRGEVGQAAGHVRPVGGHPRELGGELLADGQAPAVDLRRLVGPARVLQGVPEVVQGGAPDDPVADHVGKPRQHTRHRVPPAEGVPGVGDPLGVMVQPSPVHQEAPQVGRPECQQDPVLALVGTSATSGSTIATAFRRSCSVSSNRPCMPV